MKTAKVESKKVLKAAKPRRVAGVPVRSGVKAGLIGPQENALDNARDRARGGAERGGADTGRRF
jgi:hypothetical protein